MKHNRKPTMRCGFTGPGRRSIAYQEEVKSVKTVSLAILFLFGSLAIGIVASFCDFETGSGPRYLTGSDGPLTTTGHPVAPSSIPRFLITPILSDITTASFSISWVSDQLINASVEYCVSAAGVCDQDNFPGSHFVAYDSSEFLPSRAALVRTKNLNPGATYYYRALEKNASGGQNYSPASAPYPSVTTKTDTNIQVGNPTFNVAPYDDKNDNYQWDGEPTDAKQYDFLLYLNHTGAEALVSRGSGGSGWICTIDSNNMRSATSAGPPHLLSSGNVVTFFIVGLYNNGTGDAVWSNWTASYTIPNPKVSPVDLVKRTEVTVPDIASSLILSSASIVAMTTCAHFFARHRRRFSM